MSTVQLYQHFVATINGRQIRGGSFAFARTIELTDSESVDQEFKVAAESRVKIWDRAENESMGGFKFLWLETDLDVLVQFTTDAGGDDEYFVVKLAGSGTAGSMGPALVLGSDLAHQFNGSVDLFDGTADTIDEIWVSNQSETNVARVRLVLAT